MADIQYWDDTLTEEIEGIQQLLDQVSSIRDSGEKHNMLERVEKRLRAAQGTKRSYKMEIRLVQDVSRRREFETRLQSLDQQLMALSADQKALKQEMERGELLDRQQSAGVTEDDAVKAGDNMLKEMTGIQDKTQTSLDTIKNKIEESKETGMATLEELERQRNVITNIDKEFDRVDDNLARAEALIKQFGKRMATDKLIQCFAVTNCLLLICVVLWSMFGEKALAAVDSGTPVDPTAIRRHLRWSGYDTQN